MPHDTKKPAIVIHGNPADGFTFTGPFEDTDEAIEWAENHTPDYEQWNTALLADPEESTVDATEADSALGQNYST